MESLEFVELGLRNRDLAALSLTGACRIRFFVPQDGLEGPQSRAGTAEWLPILAIHVAPSLIGLPTSLAGVARAAVRASHI